MSEVGEDLTSEAGEDFVLEVGEGLAPELGEDLAPNGGAAFAPKVHMLFALPSLEGVAADDGVLGRSGSGCRFGAKLVSDSSIIVPRR